MPPPHPHGSPTRLLAAAGVGLALAAAHGCARRTASPAAAAPASAISRSTATPSRFELYQLLFRHGDLPLSRGKYCEGVVGVELERAPTLGDWIAFNLSVLAESARDVRLPASCRRRRNRGWECAVEFQAAGGETPWSWGVRFRVGLDRDLVAGSLTCLGAG
jgi:hypothetical protein